MPTVTDVPDDFIRSSINLSYIIRFHMGRIGCGTGGTLVDLQRLTTTAFLVDALKNHAFGGFFRALYAPLGDR